MRILTLVLATMVYLAVTAFTGNNNKLVVTSPAFANNSPIPIRYTCKGAEFSPPLNISNIPPGAKSLAIIVYDAEAVNKVKVVTTKTHGKRTKGGRQKTAPTETVHVTDGFTYWLIWNIDVDGGKIPENFKNSNEGLNGSGDLGYKAICPPKGTHYYHFRVYALDTKLNIGSRQTNKTTLEKVMQGHILSWGETVGIFNKDYK